MNPHGVQRARRAISAALVLCLAAACVACGGPTSVDQARLRQLSDDPILDQPPGGFVPDGEPLEIAGTSDLRGNRSGSEITQNFKSTEGVVTGTNAWAEQLEAQGWEIRTISCYSTHGSATAYKQFDGFTGRADASTHADSGQLRLSAPASGEQTFVTPPVPLPEPCT